MTIARSWAAVTAVASSSRAPIRTRQLAPSTSCGPVRGRRQTCTGSAGRCPCRGRRRDRTAGPRWSEHPNAATATHPPPARSARSAVRGNGSAVSARRQPHRTDHPGPQRALQRAMSTPVLGHQAQLDQRADAEPSPSVGTSTPGSVSTSLVSPLTSPRLPPSPAAAPTHPPRARQPRDAALSTGGPLERSISGVPSPVAGGRHRLREMISFMISLVPP